MEEATLTGTDGSSLAVLLREAKFVSDGIISCCWSVRLRIQNVIPFELDFRTDGYGYPDMDPLVDLRNGNSEAHFNLDFRYFRLRLREHTIGVRYGYLVDGSLSSVEGMEYAPWPQGKRILQTGIPSTFAR